jgi:LmbE family N-acetylglucosaminyl deacetylase
MPRALSVDPAKIFQGVIVILAPHMDDELLACGGTIASLPVKNHIHFVYATDGSKSPVPTLPWLGSTSTDLKTIRTQEAKNALKFLNIPDKNITFLNLPDRKLNKHINELTQKLGKILSDLKPVWLMIPFRYDRHPDHLALNRAAKKACSNLNENKGNIVEYFVYYRWRLLPGGDIRKFIHPGQLLEVDIASKASEKKKALQIYKSQTTLFFSWQDRPILPHQRVDEVSRSPEYFLIYNSDYPGAEIFQQSKTLIRIIHLIEPPLKTIKEMAMALWRRGLAVAFPK